MGYTVANDVVYIVVAGEPRGEVCGFDVFGSAGDTLVYICVADNPDSVPLSM